MHWAVWAEVTPLSTTAKVVGGIVFAAAFAAGIYLVLKSRAVEPEKAADDDAGGFSAWARSRPWRMPTAILVLLIAVLFAVGLFVDPKEQPRSFVRIWSAVLVLVLITVPLAIFDAVIVRARGQVERVRLLEESKAKLADELRARLRERARRAMEDS